MQLRDQVVESQTALAKMRINGNCAHFPDANHEAEKRELNERIVVLEAELSVVRRSLDLRVSIAITLCVCVREREIERETEREREREMY